MNDYVQCDRGYAMHLKCSISCVSARIALGGARAKWGKEEKQPGYRSSECTQKEEAAAEHFQTCALGLSHLP